MSDLRKEARSTRPRKGRRSGERPAPPPVPPAEPAFPGDPSPDERVSAHLAERWGSGAGRLKVEALSGDASTRRY